ncbi:MAG: UPF0175 family protein [Synechococcales bacterium]|nr:UPF0175 family protein [Synechococcales bacterium]
MTLQLTIPDSVLQHLHLPSAQIEQGLRKELAIALYRKAMISFDAALELADMDCQTFGQLVGETDLQSRCRRFDVNGEAVYSCSE